MTSAPSYNSTAYPATVSDFKLDVYEITVGRFRKFVSAYSQNMVASGTGKNPSNTSDPGWSAAWNSSLPADATTLTSNAQCDSAYQTWTGGDDNRPINCLSWYVAEAFCIWDGGRLPTEAEWNYAASHGGEQRVYPWGSTAPGANAQLAVYGCYYPSGIGTCTGVTNIARVGSVDADKGYWGQQDLAGNLREWTQDTYPISFGKYDGYSSSCNDCSNLSTSSFAFRVDRGGVFSGGASILLASGRSFDEPTKQYLYLGARCARRP